MRVECIPMNVDNVVLTELSELVVDVYPKAWERCRKDVLVVEKVIKNIETAYIASMFNRDGCSPRQIVVRKVMRSSEYFCKSFSRFRRDSEAIVNLAIAFETLSTDFYAPNVVARMIERVSRACGTGREAEMRTASLLDLYKARSEIVHQGTNETNVDIKEAQKLFVDTFLFVGSRLEKVNASSRNPMQELFAST